MQACWRGFRLFARSSCLRDLKRGGTVYDRYSRRWDKSEGAIRGRNIFVLVGKGEGGAGAVCFFNLQGLDEAFWVDGEGD